MFSFPFSVLGFPALTHFHFKIVNLAPALQRLFPIQRRECVYVCVIVWLYVWLWVCSMLREGLLIITYTFCQKHMAR